MKILSETCVKGGYAESFTANKGQYIKITDLKGQQVADFIAFNINKIQEKLSPSHTIISLYSLVFKVGDILKTDLRNPMFKVVEDIGKNHDMLIPACDKQRYILDYGVEGHRNCVDNFVQSLNKYEIDESCVRNPFNLFQLTEIKNNGEIVQKTGASKAGDYIIMECLMDIVGAVSACPMDLNPIGGQNITDILIQILE